MNGSLPPPEAVRAAIDDVAGSRDRLIAASVDTVLRWCAALGGPRVDAEDAAHDVLVTAWERIATLRQPEHYAAWLYGITRRVLAAHRRRAWVRKWVPGATPEAADPAASPHRDTADRRLAGRVREALARLPEAQREVLVLCEMEGRTDEEAAALLGIPSGTAKSRLRLARARFQVVAQRMGLDEEVGDDA